MEFQLLHISVDGSLAANHNMRLAVVFYAVMIAVIVACALGALAERRFLRFTGLLASLIGISFLAYRAQLWLAWSIQNLIAGRVIATTFFNPPSGWLSLAIGLPIGAIVGAVYMWISHAWVAR